MSTKSVKAVKVAKGNLTTQKDASRMQSAVASTNGGGVPKGSYVARVQAAAARNVTKTGSK